VHVLPPVRIAQKEVREDIESKQTRTMGKGAYHSRQESRGKITCPRIYLMASFGTPFFILNQFGFYEPLLALFFAFGLLFLVVGFGMYYDDWEKKSGKKRRRKAKKNSP